MVLSWMHAVAARPEVYELLQTVVGARRNRKRLAQLFVDCEAGARVIDVGGGTGAIRPFLPASCQYICIDLEWPKLQGFQKRRLAGSAVLGDAAVAPFRDGVADYVLASAVCHHLDDGALQSMFQDIRRVLKPGGRLVLLDALLAPKRLASRALWAMDRGSHPRTADALVLAIQSSLTLVDQTRYATCHEYLLAVAVK
jgi:SAM-dependent methyltransferase